MDDSRNGSRPESDIPVVAYCVYCRERRAMQSAIQVCTERGRYAIKGVCTACGKGMYRMGGWDSVAAAAKRAQNASVENGAVPETTASP